MQQASVEFCYDEKIRLLKNHGWLSTTSPEFADAVISQGRWKRLDIGDRITTAGEVKGELVALADGVAGLSSSVGYAETPLVHIFRPPFWFGYAWFIGSGPRRFTSVMRTPGWILTIGEHALTKLLDREPGGWQSVVRLAMIYGDLAATVAGDLITRKSERRVIAVLLRCSGHRDRADGPPLVSVPLTQGELADATNLSRNTVVALLQNLADRGLVGTSRGNIQIKDADGLMRILNSDE